MPLKEVSTKNDQHALQTQLPTSHKTIFWIQLLAGTRLRQAG
jgi:hypothetical protein